MATTEPTGGSDEERTTRDDDDRGRLAMASVFFRGPRASARWFARYLDAAGTWRAKRVRVDCRADALKIARQLEAHAERQRHGLEPRDGAAITMGELLQRWQVTLRNRAYKDDLSRVRCHLMPKWGGVRLADVTLPAIMGWVEELRTSSTLAPGTQRHLVGILSRAFSWAIVNGLAVRNPVRDVPAGARPQAVPDTNVKWIDDDETPARIMAALPEMYALAFYVGFACGARQGEIFGLHMNDLDDMSSGCIRIRNSYAGPLKEDKRGAGKVKFAPAPSDAGAVLGPWLARRRAEGAGPEDLVFPGVGGLHVRKDAVAYQWRRAMKALGLSYTWHHATRTSYASRAAARGVPIDQVATALGHHSAALTQRHYMKFTRKSFDPRLTAGLAPMPTVGKVLVLPMDAKARRNADNQRLTQTEDENAA